jgi:hypothetical protein
VGFDDPSRSELFSDTTPPVGRPMRDAHSSDVCSLSKSGKVRYNPAAGDIRKVELSGTWMEFWNDRVQKETDKARVMLYDKRIFGLARQTAAGLLEIGVKYEMTSIANYVRDALKYKAEGMPKGISEKRQGEYELAGRVFDAIMNYNLHKVAELLEVPPERPKTFGNTATRR